jgi:tripeptidyl-peptidase-2
MSTAYSMLEDVPETNYNWSSMGPTLDGEIGVSIMAPGAAITCVSKWTLNKKQVMIN